MNKESDYEKWRCSHVIPPKVEDHAAYFWYEGYAEGTKQTLIKTSAISSRLRQLLEELEKFDGGLELRRLIKKYKGELQ